MLTVQPHNPSKLHDFLLLFLSALVWQHKKHIQKFYLNLAKQYQHLWQVIMLFLLAQEFVAHPASVNRVHLQHALSVKQLRCFHSGKHDWQVV